MDATTAHYHFVNAADARNNARHAREAASRVAKLPKGSLVPRLGRVTREEFIARQTAYAAQEERYAEGYLQQLREAGWTQRNGIWFQPKS